MRDFLAQHAGAVSLGVLALCLLALLTALAIGLLILAGARFSLNKARRQNGAAAAEFVIVIIPFMLLLTAILQLGLAAFARVLVSYAVFSAARAAIVVVPASSSGSDGDASNQIGSGQNRRDDFSNSKKAGEIRNAAAYALIPASPSIDTYAVDMVRDFPAYLVDRATHPGSSLSAGDATSQLMSTVQSLAGGGFNLGAASSGVSGASYSVDRAFDSGFGDSSGFSGALERSLRKYVYARLTTAVTLEDENGKVKSKFGFGDPIRAKVTYLFYCQIPLANRFAGHRFYDLPADAIEEIKTSSIGSLAQTGLPGFYMALSAEHTLINQGRP